MKRTIALLLALLLALPANAAKKSKDQETAEGYLFLFVTSTAAMSWYSFVKAEKYEDRAHNYRAVGAYAPPIYRDKANDFYHMGVAFAAVSIWSACIGPGVIQGYYDGRHGWLTYKRRFRGIKVD
jgi:hypothetical protein